MNSLLKKIISSAMIVTCAAFLMGPGAAQALTAAELQVQINALLAQLSTLQSQLTTLQGGTATPGACSGITFSSNLSQGMSGSDVKCLQAILNQSADTQVAASGVGSAGNETLYFGALTKAAVVKFQEKYASEVLTPIGLTAGTGFVGAKTIAKLNSLLVSAPPVTPPVVGVPLSVALTADSPAAANLQKGTANNVLAKFTFTGSDTADTYVTGLTLKHYGNAADATITAKIFDENDIQVGTDRSVVGGLSSFVLVPALVVPKNGTKTISIAANIGSGAETLTTVQFGIDAASSIVGAAFTGSYPIKGNVFTIVPAGTLGSITLGDYANPPKLAVKIGEKDIILESFIVSAGSREDVLIKQITIDNASGTNVDSDITNIRIREVGGAVVAGPVNLLNRKATLNLSSSVLLTKGTSKKFEVVGDIVTGKTRQIGIKLLAGSIIGVGQTSGVNIVNTGATGANLITIESGALVVSQSNSHPSGTSAAFIKTVNSKALAVFSVRAAGEVVMIDTIGLTFTPSTVYSASTNYLRSVGLYDGDTLISDLKDTIAATATQTFTLN